MTPALADPTADSSSGFTSSFRAEIKTLPAQAWGAIVQLPRWWNPSHTYSGNAANLSLDAQAGGCGCACWRDAAGLDKLAPVVDGVIGEQFKRLKSLIETGQAS